MAKKEKADQIRGKVIRFKWLEGPTKDQTHELVFGNDGNVTWGSAGGATKGTSDKKERAEYGALKVAEEAYLVSFMGSSGYTLTVVVSFKDHNVVGFASNAQEWYPVSGTFEIVSSAKA